MAGTTKFSFKAKIRVGSEIVPITTEVVSGNSDTQDGVSKGFIFKLDLDPGQVVAIKLGDIIQWIEGLTSSSLTQSPGFDTIKTAFPNDVSDGNFNKDNTTEIDIKSFLINSTDKEKLFSISVDVKNSDPSQSLISFPEVMKDWLKIDNLAISFMAKKTTETGGGSGNSNDDSGPKPLTPTLKYETF